MVAGRSGFRAAALQVTFAGSSVSVICMRRVCATRDKPGGGHLVGSVVAAQVQGCHPHCGQRGRMWVRAALGQLWTQLLLESGPWLPTAPGAPHCTRVGDGGTASC